MTSSQRPWTIRHADSGGAWLLDYYGKVIAFYSDWRDAETTIRMQKIVDQEFTTDKWERQREVERCPF